MATTERAENDCPRCGATGRPVGSATVLAILKPEHARRLPDVQRRICDTRDCAVLYYAADGTFLEKSAAAVRVGFKETSDPVTLCYCFGFTLADVRGQVAEEGRCDIPERIASEIQAGRCACEWKNPSGRCCLGEVRAAVDRALAPGAGSDS